MGHREDAAPGTSHFRTTIAEGRRLMRALRGRLSGIAQPTYVLDIPGGHGKVPIAASAASAGAAPGEWLVTDRAGVRHRYPPPAGGTEPG